MPQIILSGTSPNALPIILTEDDTIVRVIAGAAIGSSSGDFHILGRDVSNTTVQVDGMIAGSAWATIDLTGATGSTVVVGDEGEVVSGEDGVAAIEVSFDAALLNAGEVHSFRGFGLVVSDPGNGSIVNDGTIFGEVGGVYFFLGSVALLVNRGLIEAGDGLNDTVGGSGRDEAVFSNSERTEIRNSGQIVSTDVRASGISVVEGILEARQVAEIVNSGLISSDWRWGIDLSELGGGSSATSMIENSGAIVGSAGGLIGSAGRDLVTNSGDISGSVVLGDGDDDFLGASGRVFGEIQGGGGDDTLRGGRNNDVIGGGAGRDRLYGGAGDDVIEGNGSNDAIYGGDGRDTVRYVENAGPVTVNLPAGRVGFPGQGWADENIASIENATTGSGADLLVGSAGANTLRGGAGADRFMSGAGLDVMIGGAGNDVFRFSVLADSRRGAVDRLEAGDGGAAFDRPGAALGDRIDLSGIDANAVAAGNQTFVFGSAKGIGRLWLEDVDGATHVRGNVDRDAVIEFDLAIVDGSVGIGGYRAADFIL